jgi:hypothetical protein
LILAVICHRRKILKQYWTSQAEFEKIDDYQVDVRIKVDVDFLKMPEREATIYYKKPDKFHIDSENFAMLPKSGLNFSPLGFLNYSLHIL